MFYNKLAFNDQILNTLIFYIIHPDILCAKCCIFIKYVVADIADKSRTQAY